MPERETIKERLKNRPSKALVIKKAGIEDLKELLELIDENPELAERIEISISI